MNTKSYKLTRIAVLLLTMILLLAVTAAGESLPTRVQYIPAPAEAFTETASYLFAATPDGRYLLIGGNRELYIWDTQENQRISLSFASQAEEFHECVMLFAKSRSFLLADRSTFPESADQWLADFTANASLILSADGLSFFRNFEQLRILLPDVEIGFVPIDVNDRYAVVGSDVCWFAVELATGSCQLYPGHGMSFLSLEDDDCVYFHEGYNNLIKKWNLVTGETIELERDRPFADFFREAACLSKKGNLLVAVHDMYMPVTDEEKANYQLSLVNYSAGSEIVKVAWPVDYQFYIRRMKDMMITENEKYALLSAPQFEYAYVMIDLGGGSGVWSLGTMDSRDLAKMPIGVTGDRFVCYRVSDAQLILLNPENGEETVLDFRMDSESMPYEYREAGGIGTHTGEVWTDITIKMISYALMNESRMIFTRVPGYFVLE